MSQNEQKKEIEKLQKVLDFPKAGMPDTAKVSYHTTMPRKNVVQGGIIQETVIDSANSTKTVSYRLPTQKERIAQLERVLNEFK